MLQRGAATLSFGAEAQEVVNLQPVTFYFSVVKRTYSPAM
jgi:hypothetical protein